MATRTTPPSSRGQQPRTSQARASQPRGSGQSRTRSTTTAGRGSTARGASKTEQLPAAEDKLPLPLRAIRGFWMGIAHLVAGAVRKFGHDVQPEKSLRRDGTGFFLFLCAAAVATVEWWALTGPVADGVHAVAGGSVGWMALLLPFILLIGAVRLFRYPEDPRANNRIGIGLTVLTFAGSGIAHLVGGQPELSAGLDALWQAGGVVGYLIAGPAAAVLSAWPVGVLLAFLIFVSILIVTATPFRHIPSRLRQFYEHLMGQDPNGDAADADEHDQSYLSDRARAAGRPRRSRASSAGRRTPVRKKTWTAMSVMRRLNAQFSTTTATRCPRPRPSRPASAGRPSRNSPPKKSSATRDSGRANPPRRPWLCCRRRMRRQGLLSTYPPTRSSRRLLRRRFPSGPSSFPLPGTSPTRCLPPTTFPPARPPRSVPRRTTPWSRRSRTPWSSSTLMPR